MRKVIAGLLLCVMVFALCSCAISEKLIVGTWKSQTTVLGVVTETKYTFNEDGTGTKSNVLDINFTYSFEEGKLLITTSTLGIENTEKFSYSFKGNKLVLSGDQETINLEKVK